MVPLHSFTFGTALVLAPFVEKSLPSLNCLGNIVVRKLIRNVWIYFWRAGSIPFDLFICPVPASRDLDYYDFVSMLKWGLESPLILFSVFKIVLLSHFHMNFRVSLLIFARKGSWYFDRDFMNSIDNFGGNFHFKKYLVFHKYRDVFSFI